LAEPTSEVNKPSLVAICWWHCSNDGYQDALH